MTDPQVVTSKTFQREFGRFQTDVVRGPIHVQKNGRPHAVFLAIDEFERLKRNDRRVYAAHELPADIREAIANSRVPAEHADLDKDEKIEIS
ncbi:MAG: type II toxin-antitoxin system Phd/YefM family antitoxin [Azospirillum sp.]|nr:type II toxin-antitoxin system Phd/YefM family antitoxin [Azospirillum sp.]